MEKGKTPHFCHNSADLDNSANNSANIIRPTRCGLECHFDNSANSASYIRICRWNELYVYILSVYMYCFIILLWFKALSGLADNSADHPALLLIAQRYYKNGQIMKKLFILNKILGVKKK